MRREECRMPRIVLSTEKLLARFVHCDLDGSRRRGPFSPLSAREEESAEDRAARLEGEYRLLTALLRRVLSEEETDFVWSVATDTLSFTDWARRNGTHKAT